MSSYSRKRRRTNAWHQKDLPAFLDATSSISVSTFGARRLPELKKLYQSCTEGKSTPQQPEVALRSGGGKRSKRHLRRRTTAIQARKRYRGSNPANNTSSEAQLSTTRKAIRGRKASLRRGHDHWQATIGPCQKDENDKDPTPSTATMPPPHWLVTHLWHTKRFHMDTLWGWRLPLAHTNRGVRSVLQLSRENYATFQDLTWTRQALTIKSKQSIGDIVTTIRRVCPDFASTSATLCGSQLGQGMFHQVDQFPAGAIGPALWRVSLSTKAPPDGQMWWTVQFMVHPSIRSSVTNCLQALVEPPNGLVWVQNRSPNLLPPCCIRLSGRNATKILQETLRPRNQTLCLKEWEWNWDELLSSSPDTLSVPESLPHGAIVRVQVDTELGGKKDGATVIGTSGTPGNSIAPSTSDNQPQCQGPNTHVKAVEQAIEKWQRKPSANDMKDGEQVLLVRQTPRPLDCEANYAVSGWDVYCSPAVAQSAWMALAMQGLCVAIGMVEESHLHLECNPPLPTFPRDYVDTEQSQMYWSGKNNTWKTVRQLYEGGWGRLPIKRQAELPQVRWSPLVVDSEADESTRTSQPEQDKTHSQDIDSQGVVVVRGAFGQPFQQALVGWSESPPTDLPTATKNRRNRRRKRPACQVYHADALRGEPLEGWRKFVSSMLDSLAMPAVLVAHVRTCESGNIEAGSKLRCGDTFLGTVTAGSFSLTRGCRHGIAVLGAKRLLQGLLDANIHDIGRVVPQPNGQRQLQIVVALEAGKVEELVTVSIIL